MTNRRRTGYREPQLTRLVSILRRTAPNVSVNRLSLRHQLNDLLRAIGRTADGSVFANAFLEYAASDPGPAARAAEFEAIAGADDPLDPTVSGDIALAGLHARARTRWSRKKNVGRIEDLARLRARAFDQLTTDVQEDVRLMAHQLAQYHRSFVKRKAPAKNDQNTLMLGLADIYLRQIGSDLPCEDLPHAERSYFIQFVRAALEPFFATTEVSPKALSRRWQRIKAERLQN